MIQLEGGESVTVYKNEQLRFILNGIKLNSEMILFDDLISIRYYNGKFLIDDRNVFVYDNTERIVNVGQIIILKNNNYFVFIETVEEVITYLNDNFKGIVFYDIYLITYTTEDKKFPGSYETLSSL
jgi:hypothetical protein